MKIQCDVCHVTEADVYCTADEASLCSACDYRVHHANKLAYKHPRFSLLNPSFEDSPHCDICQERRAFLFCKEDRAILCKECDIPIHTANEHTQKHTRFLLTGVKLSTSLSCYDETCHQTPSLSTSNEGSTDQKGYSVNIDSNSNCSLSHEEGRSVSEYFMETFP
ncbi:B-box zinc finger protein 20-like [Rutidosis leptorrhynchoides]|uniref:B-box zinc finger protein 20-like n=1 Tax=Rutidosis leptorrhynchoides TaxID=125765 RepID=UPI003A998C4C